MEYSDQAFINLLESIRLIDDSSFERLIDLKQFLDHIDTIR